MSDAFANEIDYAMLVKHYAAPQVEPEAARRYRLDRVHRCREAAIIGLPDWNHVSTSYAERSPATSAPKSSA